MVIDPTECIDCAVCIPECPAGAIYADTDLPEDQQQFLAINAELSKTWPVISKQQNPMPEAEKWDGVVGKLQHLDRSTIDQK